MICPSGSHTGILSSLFGKNILLPFFGKPMHRSARPASMKRGERVVTIVGRDAMDARVSARRMAQVRTAKACGPGAPGLVLSLRDVSQATVTKRSWTPGRARNKRSNHRAGNVDASASPVVTNSYASSLRIRGYGCSRAPGIPCALLFRGQVHALLGRDCAAGMLSHVVFPRCRLVR